MSEKCYVRYTTDGLDDAAAEGLAFYLPARDGYILHTFVHTQKPAIQSDVWRLSTVWYCDGAFARVRPLTKPHAEWEMAIRPSGRPDFIGGYAHGDEVMRAADFVLDGVGVTPAALTGLTPFEKVTATVISDGYDPAAPETKLLRHEKTLTFTREGVCAAQRVEWLRDCQIDRGYFAMLPALKAETAYYATDASPAPVPIGGQVDVSAPVHTLTLTGDTFAFSMTSADYPRADGNLRFIISDNGGLAYNKMYFALPYTAARAGDVWRATTRWQIKKP